MIPDDEGPPLVIVATVQFSRTAEEATPVGLTGPVSQNSTACDPAPLLHRSLGAGRFVVVMRGQARSTF